MFNFVDARVPVIWERTARTRRCEPLFSYIDAPVGCSDDQQIQVGSC